MKLRRILLTSALLTAVSATTSLLIAGTPGSPGPTKNRSLAINPAAPAELWVANKQNDAVVVLNRSTGVVLATIPVMTAPRNVAFNSTGSKAYVTNERGNVALDKTLLDYAGGEILGSVSVIDTASRTVIKTITTGIGTEPFGIALAPNGKYLLVSNFRSDSLSVIDPASDTVVATFAYDTNVDFIPAGKTMADLDSNNDFIADFDGPRGFAIKGTSDRAYVTHLKSGFVSVVALTLNGSGVPTSLSLAKRIDTNKYAFDNFNNPVKITAALSQGNTKFLEDITITPDGTKAWTSGVLHNVNHDVNVAFSPGAFANRVYPVINILDLTTETYQWSDPGQTDASGRIQFDWNVPVVTPTTSIHYGMPSGFVSRKAPVLIGTSNPVVGGTYSLKITNGTPGALYELYSGRKETNTPIVGGGTQLIDVTGILASGALDGTGSAVFSMPVANSPSLNGNSLYFQALVSNGPTTPKSYTNGVRAILGPASGAIPSGTLGARVAQPSRVEFSPDGRRALVLSRASEDIAVFDISGSTPKWMQITPRRDSTPSPTQLDKNHAAFAPNRMVGDLPTGMLLAEYSPRTDTAQLLVNNEISRDASLLQVNFTTGTVGSAAGALAHYVPSASDKFTPAERSGSELFADGSRDQTTGNFNNSCESCHFEGGEDGSVWARPNGPRSTIPVYGGIRRTGRLLWKSIRMNLGETGPMFGGENGGTGVFTTAECEALIAYQEKIPVPLNPSLVNGDLSPDAKLGRLIFFGLNDAANNNPTLRHANCFSCHSDLLPTGVSAFFTNDRMKILDPLFDEAHQDPCLLLKQSFFGEAFQNVNSGVNLKDGLGVVMVDRNLDGISDIESYAPMNADDVGDFTRDDANNVMCDDPSSPGTPFVFNREAEKFGVPTKMGVVFTGPYFHDHAVSSLRSTVDPVSQAFPTLGKLRNTQHDVRGSNVKSFLSSTNVDDDINLILKFIRSL